MPKMAGLLNISTISSIVVEFVIEVEEPDLVAGFKFRDFPVEREKGIHSLHLDSNRTAICRYIFLRPSSEKSSIFFISGKCPNTSINIRQYSVIISLRLIVGPRG